MYNNKRRVQKKQKYPIDKSKLTAFSDLLHPSERFGAKIDQLNEERGGLDHLNEEITRERLMNQGYDENDLQLQEFGVKGNQLMKGEISALELFNTPHQYVKVSLPIAAGRGKPRKPLAVTGSKVKKQSGYRRKF